VGTTLFLPSFGEDRVLAFAGIPATNGAAASFALGQPSFTTDYIGFASTMLNGAQTAVATGTKLVVADYANDRVVIWNAIPAGFAAAADVVVGQTGFEVDATTCDTVTINSPESIHVVGEKLIVADSNHNRVLVWNTLPTASGAAPDLVLGQQDFMSCSANDPGGITAPSTAVTATTLNYPAGIWSDGARLVVADENNNRILVWNTFPTHNGQAADLVLGQTSFTSSVANDPSTVTTAAGLDHPYFLDSNGTQLFVADHDNNRILVWNTFPTTDGARADVVLGQGSFTATTPNDDNQDGTVDASPTARTLASPSGVKLIGNRLFVADSNNNRYLVFDGL
jgi:hypothetical protein